MAEQLIAIYQIEKRHRLPAQRVDDVMVVDHMAMLAAPLPRSARPQAQELRRVEKAFEPVWAPTIGDLVSRASFLAIFHIHVPCHPQRGSRSLRSGAIREEGPRTEDREEMGRG